MTRDLYLRVTRGSTHPPYKDAVLRFEATVMAIGPGKPAPVASPEQADPTVARRGPLPPCSNRQFRSICPPIGIL